MKQGKFHYEVTGQSIWGRDYRDFVLADSEADARQGALRERGFSYVYTVRYLGERVSER